MSLHVPRKKMFIRLGLVVFMLIFSSSMLIPHKARAAIGAPFGGLDDFDDYEMCDCSGAIYSWFTPLYLSEAPSTGPLAWYPGTIAFSTYIPHPGAWLLGTYIPGVQACWMVVGYYCVPVPTIGIIAPETGVSGL